MNVRTARGEPRAADPTPGAGPRTMREVRLVGRGGDGVVTAGEILGEAVVRRGRHAQSIPTFGPERRGALSSSMLRIDVEPIRLKCSAATPDVLLVFDPTIWHHAPVAGGLRPGALLVLNTTAAPEVVEAALREGRGPDRLGDLPCRVLAVDATGIALETLGRPIPNTAMMGALVGATDLVDAAALEDVLRERFGEAAEANVAAARAGRDRLREAGD